MTWEMGQSWSTRRHPTRVPTISGGRLSRSHVSLRYKQLRSVTCYSGYQIQSLVSENPILVHCSDGGGRTGTFIAVYKLVLDYFNKNVGVLDLFHIVFEMRQQRMKMVQKPPRYVYAVKCLVHVVKEEEGDYYENFIV